MAKTPLKILEAKNWETNFPYKQNDIVNYQGSLIVCQANHTSGTYANDVASLYWRLAVPTDNEIINGNFDFWQRGIVGSYNSTSDQRYLADRILTYNQLSTNFNYVVVQDTTPPTVAQSGFHSNYCHSVYMNSPYNSILTGVECYGPFLYRMEGNEYQKLHGKLVTLSFWIRATVPGTYSAYFTNASQTQNYVTSFTVNSSYTWEFKAIVVQLSNANSGWIFDNTSSGLQIGLGYVAGPTYQTSNLGVWQTQPSNPSISAAASVNWSATSSAHCDFSQVQLNVGAAPNSTFVRCGRSYLGELQRCQRYYAGFVNSTCVLATNATTAYFNFVFPVPMRIAPSTGFSVTSVTSGVSIFNALYNSSSSNKNFYWGYGNTTSAVLNCASYSGLPYNSEGILFQNIGADASGFHFDAEL